jgi:hypothetical protein
MTGELELPPGFRFHPTDEELVNHYLCRKCSSLPLAVPIIREIDLYKYDPWQLPGNLFIFNFFSSVTHQRKELLLLRFGFFGSVLRRGSPKSHFNSLGIVQFLPKNKKKKKWDYGFSFFSFRNRAAFFVFGKFCNPITENFQFWCMGWVNLLDLVHFLVFRHEYIRNYFLFYSIKLVYFG